MGVGKTLCALDLACFHAAGADVGLANVAVLILDGDLLDVGAEPAVRDAMRVADVAPSRRLLAANFANLRHVYQLHLNAFQSAEAAIAKLALKL